MPSSNYPFRLSTQGCRIVATFAIAIAGLLASPPMGVALGAQRPAEIQADEPFVTDEVLLLLSSDPKRNVPIGIGTQFTAPTGVLLGAVLQSTNLSVGKQVLRLKLPQGKSVRRALAENWAKDDPRILVVEPNYIVHTTALPDDPRFDEMWGLHNTGQTGGSADADIDAPEAWEIETGSQSVVVAVIDTGVDFQHPDLAANIWRNPGETGDGKEDNGIDDDGNGFTDDVYGYDFLDEDNVPSDLNGHGTHVAGTIGAAGNNSLGVTGVNWQCRIMVCRFLGTTGRGLVSDGIEAINYAVQNGARILNNSWGSGGFSLALQATIEDALQAGVLFVAAAGNISTNADVNPKYPASYELPNIIAVAATDHLDLLASFSTFGILSIDLGAPGVDVLSTRNTFSTLFAEDFQAAAVPGFEGTQMEKGEPSSSWGTVEPNLPTPGNVAARGDYANSSPYLSTIDASISTPELNTLGLNGVIVDFLFRRRIGAMDELTVEVWNGQQWTKFFSDSDTCCTALDEYRSVVAGIPTAFQHEKMKVRFRWRTDGSDNDYFGAEIDNVRIRSTEGDYTNAYGLLSGTSMAAPHVSGVAALLLAHDPGISMNQLKQRLMWTGDPIPALDGKTLTGRRLNAHNALTAPPSLMVVSPNQETTWILGTTRHVRWASIGGGETVSLDLWRDGVLHSAIDVNAPNTGEFSWSIPDDLPEGLNYRIRVFDGVNTDESDNDFSLVRVFPVFSEDFEGSLGEFVIDNTFGDGNGLWHLSTGRGSDPGHSPTHSLYYGQGEDADGGGDYDVGTTDGAVISPLINLVGVAPPILLTFNYFLETEGASPRDDVAIIEVSTPGGGLETIAINGGTGTNLNDPTLTWRTTEVDLSQFSNTVIQLRFTFQTKDEIRNEFEGWYVDDITVAGIPDDGPPLALSGRWSACFESLRLITLEAFDDGLPDPPGSLSYLITSLPTNGQVSTPDGTPIGFVPFALPGSEVVYTANVGHYGPDSFRFKANDGGFFPDGGDSNEATIDVTTIEGEPASVPEAPSPANQLTRVSVNTNLAWQGNSTPPVIYAATPTPVPPQLGTVNRIDGSFQVVGATEGIRFDGLAFDRNLGIMYGVSDGGGGPGVLYTIDPSNGSIEFIGPISGTVLSRMSGLAFDPNSDTLYGIQAFALKSRLFRIDPATAVVTPIGLGESFRKITGIAYDPATDTLYGINHPIIGGAQLVTLVTTTGTHAVVGILGAGVTKADGLAFCEDDGLLYAINTDSGEAVSIDPATGLATIIGPTNTTWGGNYGLTCAVCPVRYHVYLDTQSPPTQLVCEDSLLTTCATGLLNGGTKYYWRVVAENCCGVTEGVVWSFETTCPTGPGDLDCDGDVDANDYLTFSNCYNGDSNPPTSQCRTSLTDIDEDNDVDYSDFLTFLACFNGASNPPRCP